VDRAVQAVGKSPELVALEALSPRESEVLEMTATGLTNAEIAVQLNVTVHSIKFHLASIYRKLGVANRTEAAVVYLRASATDRSPANSNHSL
jgi:DNA-binding CsgD family transcriptional regulator